MGFCFRRNTENMGKDSVPNVLSYMFGVTVLVLAFQVALGHRVKVDQEVESYPGQTVNLRCQYANEKGTALTQVSWILEATNGKRDNIAVFNPQYGASYPTSPLEGRVSFTNPSLQNPSITITDVRMTDEGRYICEYATYPSGNEQGSTSLVMLAKPNNSAEAVPVAVGTTPVVVARCVSANGRPAAQISWETSVNGNATALSNVGAGNTVTITSEYRLVPTAADNGKDITCIVNHRTQSKPERIRMNLAIEFPPEVTITGYDHNWFKGRSNVQLMCQATGNPPAVVVWETTSGAMPASVQVVGNTLNVPEVTDAVNNATFVCRAKNRLGGAHTQLMTEVREAQTSPSNAGVVAGAVIGCLLALLLVGALIAVLVSRNRQQQQGYRGNANQGSYDIKTRVFGSKKTSKNGTGSNNNGPIYTYRDGESDTVTEKSNHIGRSDSLMVPAPTAHDILLSREMDEVERRKFDELEDGDEDERYVHFGGQESILQIRPHDDMGGYLDDDDMESQRDGSVISRTAVYV